MAKHNYNYPYRITNLVTGMHYYGTRSCSINPKLDLGFKYFGSLTGEEGKAFRAEQKANPFNFRYKVLGLFATRELAIVREIFLHNKFDVGRNSKFYNKSKQTSTKFDTGGIKRSQESITKQLITRAITRAAPDFVDKNIGVKLSIEHIANMLTTRIRNKSAPNYINKNKGSIHSSISLAKGAATRAITKSAVGYVSPQKGIPYTIEALTKQRTTRAKNKAAKLAALNKPNPSSSLCGAEHFHRKP